MGATIVAGHAGDMINESALAMVGRVGLKTLSRVINRYPSQAEAIKQAANAYNRSRLTPILKKYSRSGSVGFDSINSRDEQRAFYCIPRKGQHRKARSVNRPPDFADRMIKQD
jgi:hypothetical protein